MADFGPLPIHFGRLFILEFFFHFFSRLSHFAGFVQQLLLFKSALHLNNTVNEASFLGFKLPPMIKNERQQLVASYSLKTLRAILNILLKLELQLKSNTKLAKDALLLATLIKIKTKLL